MQYGLVAIGNSPVSCIGNEEALVFHTVKEGIYNKLVETTTAGARRTSDLRFYFRVTVYHSISV